MAERKRRRLADMGFFQNLYEKRKRKMEAQASDQLGPGESLQRLVLARTTKPGANAMRQVAAFATEENVYLANVALMSSKLKPAEAIFPIADADAAYDNEKLVVSKVVRAAEDPADALYDVWVIYPEGTAGRDPEEFAAYVNERSRAASRGSSKEE